MNYKQNEVRKGIAIGVITCILVLVGFLGSYAFFINSIENNKNQEVTLEAGTMSLVFSDGSNGFNKELDFGESAEKTFTIENIGTKDGVVSVSWMNLLNTYLEGSMTYSFLESDTEDGEYTEIVSNKNVPRTETVKDKVLASGITIPARTKKYYKLIINLNYTDFDQTEDLNAKLETQFKIAEGILDDRTDMEKTLAKLGKTVKEGEPNFAEVAITDETIDGLYGMEDDYGTSYYYRGAVEDNYVKFAGFYWRIIRVNGDGSLRIIYDGTSVHENGMSSTNRLALNGQVFHTNYADAKYVGYMFGGENGVTSSSREEAQTNTVNSTIKTKLEQWYVNNIKNKDLDQKVADNIFCYDRVIPGKETTGWGYDTELGYGKNPTAYAVYARSGVLALNHDKVRPQFTCSQKNDAFTFSDTVKGNGSNLEKVGLISADEVLAAGSGKYNTENGNYYLYKGSWYWAGTPFYYRSNEAVLFTIGANGRLFMAEVQAKGGIAPVINLNAEYVNTLIGDGTINNPFREEGLES